MLLALLAACTCPSFEEMDVTGVKNADIAAAIDAAVAEFAAWTGREGVCVPGFELRDEVTVDGVSVEGSYGGPHERIWLSTAAERVTQTVRHELCHALDEQEGLSEAGADVVVGTEDMNPTLYPTEVDRREEAFAEACEAGASAVEVYLAADEVCGGSRWGLGYAYVQEHVYRALRRVPIEATDVTFVRAERDLSLPPWAQVTDAVGLDGRLYLLGDWWAGDERAWGVLAVDGDAVTLHAIGAGEAAWADAQLVRSDGPLLVLAGADGGVRTLYEIDPAAATVSTLAEHLDVPARTDAAWSEGTLYVAGITPADSGYAAVWAGGAVETLALPAKAHALAPAAGGFDAWSSDGLLRVARDGSASVTEARVSGWDLVPIGERWRLATLLADVGTVPVLVDPETGVHGLPAGPCQVLPEQGTAWARIGADVYLVGGRMAGESGRFPVTVLREG